MYNEQALRREIYLFILFIYLFIHDFFQQGSFIQFHWKPVDLLFKKALHNTMTVKKHEYNNTTIKHFTYMWNISNLKNISLEYDYLIHTIFIINYFKKQNKTKIRIINKSTPKTKHLNKQKKKRGKKNPNPQ